MSQTTCETVSQNHSLLFETWPRLAHRHPWFVLLGALVALLVTGFAFVLGRGEASTVTGLAGTESQDLIDLLEDRFPAAAGDTARIVYYAPEGLDSPGVRERIENLTAEFAALPEVLAVSSPYDSPGSISSDGAVGLATAQYGAAARELEMETIDALIDWREAAGNEQIQVEIGGVVSYRTEHQSLGSRELFGTVFAAVVLFIAFGSLVAVGLPIVTALLGLIPAFFLTGIGMAFLDMPAFTTQFAAMLGLGVGIDYALLILTRYRENLALGMSVEDAVVTASATAGKTVLFAGCSVVIALLGLWFIGVTFMGMAATGAALGVALAAIVAILVLPALLSLLGTRADLLGVPGLQASPLEGKTGFGYRLSRLIQRRPFPFLAGSLLILTLLSLPTDRKSVV